MKIAPLFQSSIQVKQKLDHGKTTIKAMAERGHILLLEAVFWYKMMPWSGQAKAFVPHRVIFKYERQHLSKPSGCPVE